MKCLFWELVTEDVETGMFRKRLLVVTVSALITLDTIYTHNWVPQATSSDFQYREGDQRILVECLDVILEAANSDGQTLSRTGTLSDTNTLYRDHKLGELLDDTLPGGDKAWSDYCHLIGLNEDPEIAEIIHLDHDNREEERIYGAYSADNSYGMF